MDLKERDFPLERRVKEDIVRIQNADSLADHGNRNVRVDAVKILEAGMTAADPYYNTRKLVRVENGVLLIGGEDFEPRGTPRPGIVKIGLQDLDRIYVFGAGKGIQQAAKALEEALGDLLTGGHIILKYGDNIDLEKLGVTYGDHPIPDENCVKGCQTIVDMIRDIKLTNRDIVFTIVGNGVSSLLTLPAGNLSLESVMEVTRVMQIEKGANTRELNNIRNSIDLLKGGRITRMLHPARMFHILTVDPNRGSTAREGYEGLTETNIWLHTLPDATSAEEAVKIIHQYHAWEEMPEEIQKFLLHMKPEQDTLKRAEFEKMDCRIYGVVPDHLGVLPVSLAVAREQGYAPHVINKANFLDAAEAGKFVAYMARLIVSEHTPFAAPCALFMTGEKVVAVGKGGGVGGRNQEFCVAAANVIAGQDRIVIGSVDTDGTDGPGGFFDQGAKDLGVTALAGGVVDGTTKDAAAKLGYDLTDALKTHDTSKLLWDVNDGVWTSHSISVQDLSVCLVK
jgi:glycerate-2-kinase